MNQKLSTLSIGVYTQIYLYLNIESYVPFLIIHFVLSFKSIHILNYSISPTRILFTNGEIVVCKKSKPAGGVNVN